MTTCTIIIKIKDYFPKIDTIPYQNFICLFTNGESEGQIPLISKETEVYKHQIKNIITDIKYKIHVLDYNDMSLIGMCEMVISYDIISQISPPNGFIQEQQKRLLIDTNTKRKLFGTVLNAGDIYLNIYSEIYLCENSNNGKINTKNLNLKKKKLVPEGSKKRLDGSPRTVRKKQIMMQINSDRRALINMNKNPGCLNLSNLDKKIASKNLSSNAKNDKNITAILSNSTKPNSSFNFKDIISKENKNNNIKKKNNINIYNKINNNNNNFNNIKKKEIPKNKQNQNYDKIKSINNYIKEKNKNLINNNMMIKYKTELNKNKVNNSSNIYKKLQKSKKNNIQKNNNEIFNNNNKNLLVNNISPKIIKDDEINFNNNTGNKITTIESLENIDFSGRKYITKANQKKSNSQSNIAINANNTLFSTTSTEQEFSDMDKIILEKGTEIRNDFNIQFKNSKNNSFLNNKSVNNTNNSNNNINSSNSLDNDNMIIKTQKEIKNNIIKLIDFYSLLSHKLFKISDKNNNSNKKNIIFKEKLFTELKKNNLLTQKKTLAEVENFMYISNHGTLNEKFVRAVIKLKKSEFKIFQNIFNLFYYEYDILKFKEFEKNKKMDENVKIELLLMVYKNLIKNYGNISQIYLSNETKKNLLKNCLNKYGIEEKQDTEYVGFNQNLEKNNIKNKDINNNNKEIKNNLDNKENNKNDMDKFKVIKEVDEEKEEEFDEEDDKLIEGRMSKNQYQINCNSNSNSNNKDNIELISNEKIKSNNKSIQNKSKSAQKKLFENNEDLINDENNYKEKLEEVKYNLSEKLITDDNIKNENEEEEDNNDINNNKNKEKLEEKNIINNNEDDNNNNILENDDKNSNGLNIDIIDINEKENKEEKDDNNINKEIQEENGEEKENIYEGEENNNKINSELNKDIKKEKENTEIIYTRKNKNNLIIKDPSQEHKETYYRKYRVKKEKEKEKELYDEEDKIMQKILIEDFPKKCKEENRFVRITKHEYYFGEEKIKVIYKDGEVVLQLDEGDYKLQEFIDILNEGKNEEENLENSNENNDIDVEENNEDIEENNNNISNGENIENNLEQNEEINDEIKNIEENDDNININENQENINEKKQQNLNNDSSSSGKKHKKRRKKRVSEENSLEKEKQEQVEKEEAKDIMKEQEIEIKENNFNYNSDISDINKLSNTDESDINSETKARKYHIKRRRDYIQQKVK